MGEGALPSPPMACAGGATASDVLVEPAADEFKASDFGVTYPYEVPPGAHACNRGKLLRTVNALGEVALPRVGPA